MAPILMHSDDGELASASAVLRMRATNAEYDQPALADRSSQRAAALLRSRSSSSLRPALSCLRPTRTCTARPTASLGDSAVGAPTDLLVERARRPRARPAVAGPATQRRRGSSTGSC